MMAGWSLGLSQRRKPDPLIDNTSLEKPKKARVEDGDGAALAYC